MKNLATCYPGRPVPKAEPVETAKEVPGAAKKAIEKQLGSNGYQGN